MRIKAKKTPKILCALSAYNSDNDKYLDIK